jgi:hypothetical protein
MIMRILSFIRQFCLPIIAVLLVLLVASTIILFSLQRENKESRQTISAPAQVAEVALIMEAIQVLQKKEKQYYNDHQEYGTREDILPFPLAAEEKYGYGISILNTSETCSIFVMKGDVALIAEMGGLVALDDEKNGWPLTIVATINFFGGLEFDSPVLKLQESPPTFNNAMGESL